LLQLELVLLLLAVLPVAAARCGAAVLESCCWGNTFASESCRDRVSCCCLLLLLSLLLKLLALLLLLKLLALLLLVQQQSRPPLLLLLLAAAAAAAPVGEPKWRRVHGT
jgi:hypothetical protein